MNKTVRTALAASQNRIAEKKRLIAKEKGWYRSIGRDSCDVCGGYHEYVHYVLSWQLFYHHFDIVHPETSKTWQHWNEPRLGIEPMIQVPYEGEKVSCETPIIDHAARRREFEEAAKDPIKQVRNKAYRKCWQWIFFNIGDAYEISDELDMDD